MIRLKRKNFAGFGALLSMPGKNFGAAKALWKAGGAGNVAKSVGHAALGAGKIAAPVAAVGAVGTGAALAPAFTGNAGNDDF